MRLVNKTPVPAKVGVMTGLRPDQRAALIVAKATFLVRPDGRVSLDGDTPLDVMEHDEPTELGLFPSDMLTKFDPKFEVMVLGAAHSPTGEPVSEVPVRLDVGSESRSLVVSGDRHWQGEGQSARIGPAEPFVSMPMGWEQAYGGSVGVEIDEGAVIDAADPRNREGKGFDHIAQARSMGDAFKCPEGFPKFPETRPLPNIEDPEARIQAWGDEPLPVCWAPSPSASGIFLERLHRRYGDTVPEQASLDGPEVFERAHPDWVIETPGESAPVRLQGMLPAGESLEFRLPRARVNAEIRIGEHRRQVELHPRTLMLLPEQRRFCIVFRGGQRYRYLSDEDRVVRIGVEKGWSPARRPSPREVVSG